MNPPALAGFVATFLRIVGSTVVGKHSAVLEGVEGSIGSLDDIDGDTAGEQGTDVESYGQLGMVVRPRVPEKIDGDLLGTEGYGFRTPEGLVPLARRDLRLNRRFPNPKPGTVALVGYGGGFLSFDDADGDTSLGTLYVPYERNAAGVVTKAHMISIGRDGNGTPFLGLISGEGPRVTLLGEEVVVASKDGSKRLEVNNDGVTAVGPLKVPSGADIGGPASVAVALAPPLVTWFAAPAGPLMAWATAVTAAVNGLAPGSIAIPLAPPLPFAATVLKGF